MLFSRLRCCCPQHTSLCVDRRGKQTCTLGEYLDHKNMEKPLKDESSDVDVDVEEEEEKEKEEVAVLGNEVVGEERETK